MESTAKQGVNGGLRHGTGDEGKTQAGAGLSAGILRLLVVATTLVAALVMATASETQTVSIEVAPTLPPLPVPVTAKASYSSAFVYFIVANAIAFAYSALSLAVVVLKRRSTRGSILPISILDAVMVGLLFSGNGAAAAFGVLGKYGNSHVGWTKVCNVFGRFCAQASASIVVSLIASVNLLALVILSMVGLHRRSSA
ncbi:CASP-like protein 1E2 [Musa acuminata AAA Group]|uniref:CASP-like protein 1E2 n=1 Tax=Musa acuminata AAA Group TaxID=214697 RepID=UPI0031E0E7B0